MHVLGTGVPRSLGVGTLCLESQSSAGLRMQPYARSPDLLWPGQLHGTGCLTARALEAGFCTVVWCLCFGLGFAVTPPTLDRVFGGCAWVQVLASPLHSHLGVVVCAAWLGFWLAPRHSWLGFRACVVVCAFRLYPATLGRAVRCGCVCLARLAAAPRHSWLGR